MGVQEVTVADPRRVELTRVVTEWLKEWYRTTDNHEISQLVEMIMSGEDVAQPRVWPPGYQTVYPMNACVWLRTSNGEPEWVLELQGSINDTSFTIRHTAPAVLSPEDAIGLPALYEAREALLALADTVDATFVDADTHDAFKAFQRDHGRALKNAQITENDRPGVYEQSLIDKVPPRSGEHIGRYLARVMEAADVDAFGVADRVASSPGEAKALAVRLDSLCNGNGGINPTLAVFLEEAFGLPAETWLEMDAEAEIDALRNRRIKDAVDKGREFPEPILIKTLPDKIGRTPLKDVLDAAQGMLDELGYHDSQVIAGKVRELMVTLGQQPTHYLSRPKEPT